MSDGNVYQLMAAVSAEIAQRGIAKDSKNAQQGYAFRGIDAVFNALGPVLAKHKLVIVPRFLSRECVERQSKNGGVLFNVTVEGEFDFVSAIDGSKHTARTYGEAMDSADKATNKAMSAAYKYAAVQAFCIPTEGDNDADAQTHEVEAKITSHQRSELGHIAKERGWQMDELKFLLSQYGVTSSKDLLSCYYDSFKAALEDKPVPTPVQ